jgi:mono/diheme cytochrome c family protein
MIRTAVVIISLICSTGLMVRTADMTVSAEPSSKARTAATLFARNCSSCHGKTGKPPRTKAKTKARNLTDKEWQERVSDERIFNTINSGKGKMPAFGKKLSEPEIDSLVKYVRDLGNK